METASLRVRIPAFADRSLVRRPGLGLFPGLIFLLSVLFVVSTSRAEIPWGEAKVRLAAENEKLARRSQGHAGTYFVICTLYYTPMESGFTAQRGFDVTPVKAPGLRGHAYPREFLAAVKKEGFGRIAVPVDGLSYIRYNGRGVYRFASHPVGRGANALVARASAAARKGKHGFADGTELTTLDDTVNKVFRSARWQIVDTGGALKRWQVDLYWGDDEPLGPGSLAARPRGTTFEYAYSFVTMK